MSSPSSTDQLPQSLDLLSFPLEIQREIYNWILVPWSLAIFDPDDEHEFDPTVELTTVKDLALSGPPGCNLMLTCHFVHDLIKHQFENNFTGRMYVGPVGRLGPVASGLPRGFRRWYGKVHTITTLCPSVYKAYTMYFTRLFRKLRTFDCVLWNENLGAAVLPNRSLLYSPPMVGSEGFLAGSIDDYIENRSGYIRNALYFRHPRIDFEAVELDSGLAEGYLTVVKMLSSVQTTDGTMMLAGALVHCTYMTAIVLARAIRDENKMVYWEEGMSRGHTRTVDFIAEEKIPEKLKWIAELNEFDRSILHARYRA